MENLPKLITRIELDTSAETKEYLVQAKQGDKAVRFVSVLIVNDGKEFEPPADALLIANFLKPDGRWCYNAAVKERETNRILVELTNQVLAVPGKLYAEIEARKPDGSQILTSCQFTIEIGPGLRNEEAILSSNEMTAFDQKWAKVTKDTATWEAAERLRAENERLRVQAEEARAANDQKWNEREAARVAAEDLRKQAETGRSAAEETRNQAEQSRSQTEEVRAAAELARGRAEEARRQAEETRNQAEQSRSQAETGRSRAEGAREAKEQKRETAEQDRERKTGEAIQKTEAAAAKSQELIEAATTAKKLDEMYASQLDGTNTDDVFTRWWAAAKTSGQTMTELLGRWFDLMKDEATYGVKFYHFDQSAAVQGVLLHDTARLGRCVPGTNTVPMVNPYMNTAAFWIRDVAYEIENKDVVIKAVAGIDGVTRDDLLTGKYGMVGVAQKSGWVRHTDDGVYTIHEYRTAPAAFLADVTAFQPLAEAVRVDKTLRPFVVHAKYAAGRDKDGKLTSATGLPVVNFMSMSEQITEWRKRGPDYSGMSGCDNAFRMLMVWLLFGVKGNSGVLEGCTGYSFQYMAAAAENGVTRVLLTAGEAANVLVGSTVSVGVKTASGSADRYNKEVRKDADLVKVLSITDETVGGKEYKAVNLETPKAFDTVAGTTMISSMPWTSGSCDHVLGTAGSPTSCTSGKEPFIIQGLESQQGAYMLTADQLIVQKVTGNDYTHQIAFFREAAKISTSDAAAALSQNILKMPADIAAGWKYIEDLAIDKDGNMYPTAIGKAASTTGARAALYVLAAGARVCALWAWAHLSNWGLAGLPCVGSNCSVGNAYWLGLVGACGSGANRGEYVGR